MSTLADLLQNNGEYAQNHEYRSLGSFVQGVVTDNSQSAYAGKVQVEFTAWTDGKNICEWVPLVSPYAGKEYGRYLVPEVKDVVLVGFIGPGITRPFVLGSFFPPDSKLQDESFNDKNLTRRFKTKGGIDITLSDEDKKQSITAVTPGGLTLSLSDEKKTVMLADKNKSNQLLIDCDKGEIKLTGKSKITVTAGSCKITLDGQAGKLGIECGQLEIKASQKTQISGGPMLDIKGGMIKVTGDQMVQMKGQAMVEISGGMVKIN